MDKTYVGVSLFMTIGHKSDPLKDSRGPHSGP